VGIAMDYGLDGRGSIHGKSKRLFFTPQRPGCFWGPLPLLSNGYRGLILGGITRLGSEADHSPPSSAEVRNGETIPLLPIRLHGVVRN
jgi:hypothetical protein